MKTKKPSEIDEEYWVYARSKNKKKYSESTENCGKWMIFAYKGEQLDNIWENKKRPKGVFCNDLKR